MSKLTKECYQLSSVVHAIKEKDTNEYEEQLVTLREINKKNTINFVEAILSDKTTELSEQLIILKRLSSFISSSFEDINEQLLLQLGEFQGITLLVRELVYTKDEKKSETELMQKHLHKKHIKEILEYLYLHPSAGHKELAEAVSVKANHLSELLKDLIEDDIVRKTSQSKYSFYSLSYQANEYTKSKLINGLDGTKNPFLFSPFFPRTNPGYNGFKKDNEVNNIIKPFVQKAKINIEEEDAS